MDQPAKRTQKAPPEAKPAGRGAAGKRRLALIDLDTGEIIEGVPVLSPKVPGIADWVMTMQERIAELAQDREITGETWRVLMFLFGQMAYENWVRLSLAEIGDALGMKRQSVHRAMRVLVAKDVVEASGTTVGGAKVYRINKHVAWKGKVRNWQKAKRGDKPPLRVIAGTDTAEAED